MARSTVNPRPGTQAARRARGNASEQAEPPETCCAFCGCPFRPRRRWARYCSPTCRVADFDRRTGRTSHAKSDN